MKINGKYKKTGYTAWLSGSAGNEIGFTQEKDRFKIYDFGQDGSDNYEPDWLWAASYSSSVVVEKKKGGQIQINEEAKIRIKNKAFDSYLNEQGIDAVEITVEMYYGWDGSIWFVFGPSGAFFEPEMELEIKGGYVEEDMVLIGEDGEFLEYRSDKKGTKLNFYIPHFSSYSYDHYDY